MYYFFKNSWFAVYFLPGEIGLQCIPYLEFSDFCKLELLFASQVIFPLEQV